LRKCIKKSNEPICASLSLNIQITKNKKNEVNTPHQYRKTETSKSWRETERNRSFDEQIQDQVVNVVIFEGNYLLHTFKSLPDLSGKNLYLTRQDDAKSHIAHSTAATRNYVTLPFEDKHNSSQI
jgi:hypothetical protein